MDIVIVADFCGNLNGNSNNRFQYLAELLSASGHQVEIVTSDFDHAAKTHYSPLRKAHTFKTVLLHEPGYRKNISFFRFFSHFVWGRNVRSYLHARRKPDTVYCAVPTLTAALFSSRFCNKNSIRFIIDVQDLWPEAFQMVFHLPVLSGIVFFPFQKMANEIYRRADEICAVSQTYGNRAISVNPRCTCAHNVFIGTDLGQFEVNARENPVKKTDGKLWLGYCGTLGASYRLDLVVDALAMLRQRGISPPKLIVMGDGPKKGGFERYAEQKHVDALFTGSLPYGKMCGMLSACDMTVNPIRHGTAASIINKHADYAAAGKAVLNTQESAEYIALLEKYQMGFSCSSTSPDELADKIELLLSDDHLRKKMGENAGLCAKEVFDRKKTYRELIDAVLGQYTVSVL